MTSVEQMTDERFALEVLQREIGPDGLARCLRLNRSGKADYTRDRSSWQDGLTVEQIVDSINRPPQE